MQLQILQPCLPCSTTSLSGAALETITYGYLLLQGAKLLSDGSEGLLEVLDNPGLVGGRLVCIDTWRWVCIDAGHAVEQLQRAKLAQAQQGALLLLLFGQSCH